MRKTKLEVIKINEDVIATSGDFCTNHVNHAYFTDIQLSDINDDKVTGTVYIFKDGKWHSYLGTNKPTSLDGGNTTLQLEGYSTGKYYVENATHDGFVECTNHHNPDAVK